MGLERNLIDESYMKNALALAKLGEGFVNPNPMVGAVIVKNGKIIGAGYHKAYGLSHAEVEALRSCRSDVEGAQLYVTLEPCCHVGKNPPCTKAIIESGIKKVVVGSLDPNPKVAGQGIQILRAHGIEVITGVLQKECDDLNKVFFHYIQKNEPYIIMKYAMTMDGKIATVTGESKWITSQAARERVHQDRHRYMGIMVGVGTVLQDDPSLDCRHRKNFIEDKDNIESHSLLVQRQNVANKEPIRIICDTHLHTPLTAKVVTTASQQTTIIATSCQDEEKWKPYLEAGCEILLLNKDENGIDLRELVARLGERGIDSVLLEGGSTLNGSFLTAGLVNKVQCYIAPKIFGGQKAISPVGGIGIDVPKDCLRLSPPKIEVLGEDILLESEVLRCLPG